MQHILIQIVLQLIFLQRQAEAWGFDETSSPAAGTRSPQIVRFQDWQISNVPEFHSFPLHSEYFDYDSSDKALFPLLVGFFHYHKLVKQVTLHPIGWILLRSPL